MKNTILSILIFSCLIIKSQSFIPEENNKHTIGFGIGTNFLFPTDIKNKFTSSGAYNYSIKSKNNYLATYEFTLSENLGIGAEVNTSVYIVSFDKRYGDTTNSPIMNYKYSVLVSRVLFRGNYHFFQDEDIDIYGFFGAGLRLSEITLLSNNYLNTQAPSFSNLMPIGIKIGVGGRYYFLDNAAIFAEISYLSPNAVIGFSYRFIKQKTLRTE